MHYLNTIVLALAVFIAYSLVKRASSKAIEKYGLTKQIPFDRIQYVKTVAKVCWLILALLAAGMIIGLDYHNVGVIFGSIFAVIGVALFAQWSILSNVTSSVVIFFFFPFKVGDQVKIVDGDNSIEGRVREITLFHIILENGEHTATYPNAMIFQKAVIIKPASNPGSSNGDHAL